MHVHELISPEFRNRLENLLAGKSGDVKPPPPKPKQTLTGTVPRPPPPPPLRQTTTAVITETLLDELIQRRVTESVNRKIAEVEERLKRIFHKKRKPKDQDWVDV
jgi:hypothetical protein